MKKILLLLTVACIYKTSVHGMEEVNKSLQLIQDGLKPSLQLRPEWLSDRTLKAIRHSSTRSLKNNEQDFRDFLEKQDSQSSLANVPAPEDSFNLLIKHFTILALLKIIPKNDRTNPCYASSQQQIDSQEAVLQSLTNAIDNQDYRNTAHILQNNNLHQLLLFEKTPLIERARAYEFVNNLRTEHSIKLKSENTDFYTDLSPDFRCASARETSKNIVQLLQVKLYKK